MKQFHWHASTGLFCFFGYQMWVCNWISAGYRVWRINGAKANTSHFKRLCIRQAWRCRCLVVDGQGSHGLWPASDQKSRNQTAPANETRRWRRFCNCAAQILVYHKEEKAMWANKTNLPSISVPKRCRGTSRDAWVTASDQSWADMSMHCG